MVNFNNESTIGTPRGDILSVLILQRRNDAIEGIEAYRKTIAQHSDPPIYFIKAPIGSFFFEVRAGLKNALSDKDFAELVKKVGSDSADDLVAAFTSIDEWLYSKNITKFDTRTKYDTSRVEEENKDHEF